MTAIFHGMVAVNPYVYPKNIFIENALFLVYVLFMVVCCKE